MKESPNKSAENRIKNSLKHVLLNKACFGKSKFSAKQVEKEAYLNEHGNLKGWNPAYTDGIYSVNTMSTYIREAELFATYCAAHGVKRISEITPEIAEAYLRECNARNLSAWSISTKASAINKALGFELSPSALGLPKRSIKDIKRSRIPREHDNRDFSADSEQIIIAKGSGIRRESMTAIRPCDCVRNAAGKVVGIHVIEKGGKSRVAPILNIYVDSITEIVNQAEKKRGKEACIFETYNKKIDNHRFRAEYAGLLLHQLEDERAAGKPLFQGNLDPNKYLRLSKKDKARGPVTKGHDTDILGIVSGALGHNRIEIVLRNYLYTY